MLALVSRKDIEEARIGLSDYKVGATLAVSDMDLAREFYEQKLDLRVVVDELVSKGVHFEHYEEPGLRTAEKGIATFEGDARVAYLRDPDGNTLSIAQATSS
jgi:catechol 2,3-dioxygenase-like lactoylglutathione lyase family enzyme